MMEFDGEARFKVARSQRHTGALRREGFLPARRHPSASRHRGVDHELLPSMNSLYDGRLREYSGSIGGLTNGSRPRVFHENSSGSAHPERSWSAPPTRPTKSTRVSVDMKLARAHCAAQVLSQIDVEQSGNILEKREIQELYAWLQEISLQEHLPALLQMGVEAVGHLTDVEEQDLDEAGLSRPERKRFLRKQTELLLKNQGTVLRRPQSVLSDRSNGSDNMSSIKQTALQLSTPDEHVKENIHQEPAHNVLHSWTPSRQVVSEPRGYRVASLSQSITTSVPGAIWTSCSATSHRSATDSSTSMDEYCTPSSQQEELKENLEGEAYPSLSMRSLSELKEHLRAVCQIVRDADSSRSTPLARGFLAQLGDAAGGCPVLLACSTAIASPDDAARMTAVFAGADEDRETHTELLLRLDPNAFWSANPDLGYVAVALCDLEPHLAARLTPIPVADSSPTAGEAAVVLHGSGESGELGLHRVREIQGHLLLLADAAMHGRHSEAGSPAFSGSTAIAMCLSPSPNIGGARAVLLSALLRDLPRRATRTAQAPSTRQQSVPPLPSRQRAEDSPLASPEVAGSPSDAVVGLNGQPLPHALSRARPPRPATLPSLCPPVMLSAGAAAETFLPQDPQLPSSPPVEAAPQADARDAAADEKAAAEESGGRKGPGGRQAALSLPTRVSISMALPRAPPCADPTQREEELEEEEDSGRRDPAGSIGARDGGEEEVRTLVELLRARGEAAAEEAAERDLQALRALEARCGSEGEGVREEGLAAECASAVLEAVRRREEAEEGGSAEEATGRGLSLLGALAFDDRAASQMVREGGIKQVLRSMRRFAASATVQGRGCRLLCNLMFESPAVQRAVGAAGGVEAVLRAMGEMGGSATVQAEGCSALCNLGANCADNEEALRREGAVEAAVRAMTVHGTSADVQTKACCAVSSLMGDPRNQQRAVEVGGVGAMVKAMVMYGSEQQLMHRALGAMLALAGTGEMALTIGRQGGVAAVVKGLGAHQGAERVQAKGLLALLALCKAKENQALALRHGGAGATVAALQRHGAEEDIAEAGCAVLRLLCGARDGMDRVAKAGGVEAAVHCMAECPDHVGVHVEAASTLSLLALSVPADELGPAEHVPAALRALIERSPQAPQALHAAAVRLERALAPRSVPGDAACRPEAGMLAHGSKRVPRRPLSAVLRPPSKGLRPTSATEQRGHARPCSATVAGSGLRVAQGLQRRGGGAASGLELEREIVGLQATAEGLRHANLLIMARAVQGKEASMALAPVQAHTTLDALRSQPDRVRESAASAAGALQPRSLPTAKAGKMRLGRGKRPPSGKSIRASSGEGTVGKIPWGWAGDGNFRRVGLMGSDRSVPVDLLG